MVDISDIEFGVVDIGYITLKEITFRDVKVPKGFIFDGVTVKAPLTVLFSQKNLRNGVRASCLHDYMCKNKKSYSRKKATKILCDIWKKDGLGAIRVKIVYFGVEFYQILKGWK